MILNNQKLPKKSGSHIKIFVSCDRCNKEYKTEYRYLIKSRKRKNEEKDYCVSCLVLIRYENPEYVKKMSDIMKNNYINNPEIAIKISKTCIEKKINVGEKNGMKKIESKNKVSETRKKMFKDGRLSGTKISENLSLAWKNGLFDNVKVGRCKWYDFKKQDGTIIKCQGTWELKFVTWLEEKNIQYIAHKERIPYLMEGKQKFYYPDFFIFDWNCFVDIKNEYHYKLQFNKFENIIKSNPNLKLKILLKKDLISLGIKF